MLSRMSVKKPFTVIVAIVIVIILGVISYTNIGVDMLPGMNLPYIAVVTVYPGATPETVEKEVTNVVEDAMSEVSNIKQITSTSYEHFSMVVVEFNANADIDKSYNNINEKLQYISFPDSELLQEPILMKINPSMLPIMSLSVGIDGKSIKESSAILNEAVEKIKGVSGVSGVSASGLISDLVYVNMKVDKLIDTIVDYLYDTFGIEVGVSLESKKELLKAFQEADVANMTEPEVIDLIIRVLNENSDNLEDTLWVEQIVSFLEKEKNDPDGTTYQLCTQLLSNKFIFREDADPEYFYSFVDALTANSVKSFFNAQVSSVFANISPDILNQLIYAQDFEMPAGSVTEGSIETIVKIGPNLTTREEFLKLPVVSFDLGSTYASYFNQVYLLLNLIGSRLESETLIFTRSMLEVAIEGIRVTIQEGDPLYEFFQSRTNEQIAGDVIIMLEVLNRLSPDAVGLPETEDGEYTVNLPLLKEAIASLQKQLVIPLQLNSFADVTYFDNSTATLTYMLTRAMAGEENAFNTSGAVIVTVNKEPDKSTVEITNGIIAVLDSLKGDENFEGFQYTVLSNDGDTINFMLDTVLQNLLWGGILAVIILLLFLRNIKATLVVGSSIIISVVFTFVLMYFTGITLNIVSMGGLALGVGMLVDNSIVVIENIYRMKSQGKNVFAAAIQGAKQVGGAIIASTLTTMIVFLPIVFISGLTKEIFSDMALTICFSLLASLLVALTLVPMAASTFMRKPQKKASKVMEKVRKGYATALNFSLKHKAIPLVLVTVLFGLSIFTVFKMDIVLFPASDSSTLSVSATIDRQGLEKYNQGKSEEDFLSYESAVLTVMEQLRLTVNGNVPVRKDPADATSELVKYSEKYDVSWINSIDAVGLYLSGGLSVGGFSLGEKSISMDIILVNEKDRDIGSGKLTKELNSILERDEVNKGLFEWTVSGGDMMSSMGMGSDSYTVRLYGRDMDVLRNNALGFSQQFQTEGANGKSIYAIDGVTGIDTGLETDNKEYKINIDRVKASAYGLTVAQIYLQVADALKTVSASHTLNLYTDDFRNESDIYIYDTSYDTTAWYVCTNDGGEETKIYLKNNISDKNGKAEYYAINDSNKGRFIRTGDTTYEYVAINGKIPLTFAENTFSYSYIDESAELEIKETTVTFTKNGAEIYYGAGLIHNFDLMTMNIQSEDLLNTGAPKINVPLYKLLKEDCFVKDAEGNVIYNETALGEKIPIGFVKSSSYLSINHEDKRPYVAVTFKYDSAFSTREIESKIKEAMEGYDFDSSIEVKFSSGNPYVNEVFTSLIFVLALAVVLIYLLMVAQFQSLKSPLIIMFTIPLAFTGGIFAIFLAAKPMSVMALMGLIVLIGVVVNNGIVFVDYCNQLIRKGVPKRVALIRTGMDRIRPILMTALTTIVALITMAADGSEGGGMLQPLAITSIGGMIFSTLLTLFIVPIAYDLFHRKARRTERDIALAGKDKQEEDDGLDTFDEESKQFIYSLSGMSGYGQSSKRNESSLDGQLSSSTENAASCIPTKLEKDGSIDTTDTTNPCPHYGFGQDDVQKNMLAKEMTATESTEDLQDSLTATEVVVVNNKTKEPRRAFPTYRTKRSANGQKSTK